MVKALRTAASWMSRCHQGSSNPAHLDLRLHRCLARLVLQPGGQRVEARDEPSNNRDRPRRDLVRVATAGTGVGASALTLQKALRQRRRDGRARAAGRGASVHRPPCAVPGIPPGDHIAQRSGSSDPSRVASGTEPDTEVGADMGEPAGAGVGAGGGAIVGGAAGGPLGAVIGGVFRRAHVDPQPARAMATTTSR